MLFILVQSEVIKLRKKGETNCQVELKILLMKSIVYTTLIFVLFVSCNTQISREIPQEQEAIPADYDPEARLAELGIELPEAATPVANYVNAVQAGNLIFLPADLPDVLTISAARYRPEAATHLSNRRFRRKPGNGNLRRR